MRAVERKRSEAGRQENRGRNITMNLSKNVEKEELPGRGVMETKFKVEKKVSGKGTVASSILA